MESNELISAEEKVNVKLANFETAMDHLIEKVDHTKHEVQSVMHSFLRSGFLLIASYLVGAYLFKKRSSAKLLRQRRNAHKN